MIAWHYTIGDRLASILASGFLLPATAGVPRRERPAVWFTTRCTFEPTACKGAIGPDGIRRELSVEETEVFCGGLVRFGTAADDLVPWPRLMTAVRMKVEHAKILERAARARGSDPSAWFGFVGPVPIKGCRVERWEGGAWVAFGS